MPRLATLEADIGRLIRPGLDIPDPILGSIAINRRAKREKGQKGDERIFVGEMGPFGLRHLSEVALLHDGRQGRDIDGGLCRG